MTRVEDAHSFVGEKWKQMILISFLFLGKIVACTTVGVKKLISSYLYTVVTTETLNYGMIPSLR